MSYQALVIDLDGTLVSGDGNVSPANVAAMNDASDAGIRVAISTGRPPRGCARALDSLGLRGLHIFYDGALVSDLDCQEVVYREPLSRDAIVELAQLAGEKKLHLELYADDRYYVEAMSGRAEEHTRLLGFPPLCADLRQMALEVDLIKAEILLDSGSQDDQALLSKLRQHFEGRLRFSAASSPVVPGVEFVNVTSPRASKGEALRHLVRAWRLDLAGFAAIGDGDNDLPLLELVGLAIAMGNATRAVKAAARYVTEPVDRDGVAVAVRRWILPLVAERGRA